MTDSKLKRRVTTHCGIKIDSVAMVIALLNLNNLQLQKANGGRIKALWGHIRFMDSKAF